MAKSSFWFCRNTHSSTGSGFPGPPIKVSAERFSDRFEREVHAVAALNHPNICHIYDVGPNYLVMELIDGPTMAERIKAGAMPLEEVLPEA